MLKPRESASFRSSPGLEAAALEENVNGNAFLEGRKKIMSKLGTLKPF